MAKKKNTSPTTTEKPLLLKIAGGLGHLAGEIVAEKNHLVEVAGDKIDSMKKTIQNITAKKEVKKPAASKKTKPIAKPVRTATKKLVKPAPVKKAAPKKAAKQISKKTARKK